MGQGKGAFWGTGEWSREGKGEEEEEEEKEAASEQARALVLSHKPAQTPWEVFLVTFGVSCILTHFGV